MTHVVSAVRRCARNRVCSTHVIHHTQRPLGDLVTLGADVVHLPNTSLGCGRESGRFRVWSRVCNVELGGGVDGGLACAADTKDSFAVRWGSEQ
jgi:cytosine/adenosine deaminase-related metal-dependent hydrolase